MKSRGQRQAFTLIELLVVMAIIGVLMSLLLAGVMAAMNIGAEAANMNEITQLSNGIQAFYSKYGFYPPSRIRIRSAAPGVPDAIDNDTAAALRRMYPKLASPYFALPAPLTVPAEFYGDQCLVLFLRGPDPTKPGWATNPADPLDANSERVGPFYEFKAERIKSIRGTNAVPPSYLDYYGQMPYLYFSSGTTRNNYNRYGTTDCPAYSTVLPNVWPYRSGAGLDYLNPGSYQILSAGRNKKFGYGSTANGTANFWTAINSGSSGALNGAATGDGRDDQSNFHPRLLGN